MGVPKFFRYISERYPCLSETVKEYQIPEFDNLYLDMNGIIHTCSHPDDGDPHFRITEEKIFQDIFHYIEVLFRMIKPQKLFFMAIDGVAPRAKMNQQRGRRFRSAKEAQVLENRAKDRGEILPTEARFDSNCITPGTVFMTRLHEQLKYFVVNKVSTDKLWTKCKIILSGHETPGEGEHKIMDYIRYMRSQPGYDPNTRHCLYGLDADLIMLGLCTHEPHFSLLREEVKFGKKSNKRKNIPEQITFFLLHLSLMREYLELEFYPLKESLSFEYDMDKIIDDWVLMGFLVGNDFIPNLPNMHIANGALPILYKAYMTVLPKLGGYINESGTLNLPRFEAFIKELGSIDIENFTEKYADLKWFQSKTGRHLNEIDKPPGKFRKLEEWQGDDSDFIGEALEEKDNKPKSELASLIKLTDKMLDSSESSDNEDTKSNNSLASGDELLIAEFVQHKNDYYINKLEYANVTQEVLRSQAEQYVRAIQWNLHYYYNGVCSWSWFYPHHYAPYVSDIKDFSDFIFEFELGNPFKPYEQLLAVLPAASKSLLPVPYQDLMTNENSPIKEYYPEDFKTDLNGKKQEWEAVVLIPFIAEDVLLQAMQSVEDQLTLEECARNAHGPMLLYQYTSDDLRAYQAPEYFPNVPISHATCIELTIEDIRVAREKLVKGAYPGAKFDVYYPGFPTMKHLKYKGVLEKAKVKVFEQQSRGESMILRVEQSKEEVTTDKIAKELLGKSVHVAWPHLVEALVIAVSDKEHRYNNVGEQGQYNVEDNKGNLAATWQGEKSAITELYKNRLGVNVGSVDVLVHVKVMVGRKYIFSPHGYITLEKQWSSLRSAYPLQTVVSKIQVFEDKYTSYKDIQSVFPNNSTCFMLGQPYYGSLGTVVESKDALTNGRVKLHIDKVEEPDLTPVMEKDADVRTHYMNLHVASTRNTISKHLFMRITGSIMVIPGRPQGSIEDLPRTNIGLNLKFSKRNEEIPGYTRREGNIWLYSQKAVALVRAYIEKFPLIVDYLVKTPSTDMYYEEDFFPNGDAKEKLREITNWIKQQPFYSIEHQVCGSVGIDPEAIQLLEELIHNFNSTSNIKPKVIVMQVKPHLLFKPELQMGNLKCDPQTTFELYDRVVNVREGFTVPIGYKGTIIGIYKPNSSKEIETMYDVLFDKEFSGGLALNCSPNRGYRMCAPALINISHGLRVMQKKVGKPGQLLSKGNQNAGPLKNNSFNPNHQSQMYPSNPNWYHNTNYQSGSSTSPMQNYPYRPNYGGPFVQTGFNYYNTPPNYNNPGPNSFVPYKLNHFPLAAPPFSNCGVPFDQKPVPNQRFNNSNDVRILKPQTTNGNAGSNSRYQRHQDSKDKEKVKHLQENKVNKIPPLMPPKVVNNQTPEAQEQLKNINTDMLKKLLKINDNSASATAVPNAEPIKDVKQTVETAQPKPYNTVQLLSNFKALNLGCPNYQYFDINSQCVAQIVMPNGSIICGDPGKTKVQAAENAATKAMLTFKGTDAMYAKPPVSTVPIPPKKWQNAFNNQYTAAKQSPKPRAKQEISRSENRCDNGRSGPPIQEREYYNNQSTSRQAHGSAMRDTAFVPLQAVRKQRTRTISSEVPDSLVSNNSGSDHNGKIDSERTKASQAKSNVVPKPRRQRKMRIAANFPSSSQN